MSEEKKVRKMSYLTVEILSILYVIVGGLGISICIGNWEKLNLIHTSFLCGISVMLFVTSLSLLIVHHIFFYRNKEKMSYREYNTKFTFDSKTEPFQLIVLNMVLSIIVIILIILVLIL